MEISETSKPFIIAEIGVNYYDIATKEDIDTLEAAKLMIKEAANAGADAVKFQTYKAEKLASKNSPAYWDRSEEATGSQYELFSKFDKFGLQEYKELADHCRTQGIIFLSTPFDFESADYLYDLMPLYKISSSDLTNLAFIEYIAKKGKAILLATGASTLGEIEEAANTVLKTGNKELCLMHCVLDYPTDYEDANLNMIKHLEAVFPDHLIGYSDHTRPDETMMTLTTAYLYGAKVIEKHFTLDKTLPGNDHYHAMDPDDLKMFVNNINLLQKISGQYYKHPLECEKESRKQARRSIVAKVSMKKGEILTREKVTFKRPGTGISPADLDKVLGREITKDILEDDLISWHKV
ncbi:acetylneuraminic acid synthetase [Methanococcoides methylutens]|uniref:Acetylneuraminic acid synthetase n=2 Tax=Methanococcoides methylutens TaxID=2226 RepID=A0A099T2D1_METMT|nr:acetylneuraminic acid synthetase [Methanococcoides methylutens]